MRINIISDFIYGDHATEETFRRAFLNLGHLVTINQRHLTEEWDSDLQLTVHIKHTWTSSAIPTQGKRVLFHPDSIAEFNPDLFRYYHLVFLSHNSSLIDNRKVFYLPFAYDSAIKHFPKRPKRRSATFIGTYYPEREFLRGIPNLAVFGNGWGSFVKDNAAKWAIESEAKIGVNHVRPDTTDNNIRMYELAALGTFQLTNKVSPDFEDGKDMVVYNSPKDLEEKIAYYLEHEKKREKIAKHGQETGRKFTFEYRAEQILKLFENSANRT